VINIKLKRITTQIALGISTAFLPVLANAAAPATAPATAPADANDECSQEILLSYFPSVFVGETLSKFNVPKDQWEAIKKELSARDREVIKQVEAKAAKMNPNPLKDPEQRQAAVKLFRESLYENFSAVLKSHGVQDEKQIQNMLDDIQQQKAKRFAHCMEVQRNAQQQGGAQPQVKKEGNAPMIPGPTSPAQVNNPQSKGGVPAQKPSSEEDDDSDDDSDEG